MDGSISTEDEHNYSDQRRRRLATFASPYHASIHTDLHKTDQRSNTRRSLPLHPPRHVRMREALLRIRIPSIIASEYNLQELTCPSLSLSNFLLTETEVASQELREDVHKAMLLKSSDNPMTNNLSVYLHSLSSFMAFVGKLQSARREIFCM